MFMQMYFSIFFNDESGDKNRVRNMLLFTLLLPHIFIIFLFADIITLPYQLYAYIERYLEERNG